MCFYMSFGHVDYFEVIVLKKQQVQPGLSGLPFSSPEQEIKYPH